MEEYKFKRIVNAQYKADFRASLSEQKKQIGRGQKSSQDVQGQSLVPDSLVKNPARFYSTIYGQSYGKASYSNI